MKRPRAKWGYQTLRTERVEYYPERPATLGKEEFLREIIARMVFA
jgi:hypothetical protein